MAANVQPGLVNCWLRLCLDYEVKPAVGNVSTEACGGRGGFLSQFRL